MSFFAVKIPLPHKRAASAIINTIRKLESYPDIGRLIDDNDFSFRELLIDFGDTGYLAMYHMMAVND
ncbi:MAG: type II toxin-antitoxin system RelE/ParE family toxin [Shewanella xiamenensis]|nr:type II toxin-antitoxin system RelE/ParE family toxin [Shewanella xiamenensis]